MQLLLSGKAHPRDGAGKEFIREMLDMVKREGLSDSVVFLEDYDLRQGGHAGPGRRRVAQHSPPALRGFGHQRHEGGAQRRAQPLGARRLVGRGLPAGGRLGHRRRAGMRAIPAYQDQLDAESLYSLLENEMVPLFYSRDADGLPRGWIAMMKESIKVLAPAFSGDRMVKQYAECFYLPGGRPLPPAGRRRVRRRQGAGGLEGAGARAWPGVKIVAVGEDGRLWTAVAARRWRWASRCR